MYQIVHHEIFSDATFLWEVFAPDVAKAAEPGQFVMLRLHENGERIPLTIADFDRSRGTVTLVIQALGRSTREMLSNYKRGDWFLDFVGPLGVPSHVDEPGHVVLVGGGLGVAPIYPQARAFKQAGHRVTSIIGFRSQNLVFWEQRFAEISDELIVCTDDGSHGRAGLVTAALAEVITREPRPARVIGIGPLPMMRAVAEVTRPSAIPTVVSLNAIMVDGTGMCGSCRVTIGGEVRFACVDGPDFDAHAVDFEELSIRQRRFKGLEQRAEEDFNHVCNLELQLFEEGKRNYKKLKQVPATATPMPERPALERSRTFDEVGLGYTEANALLEAERCIQCVHPTCIAGCPVNIDIPRFIRHILVRDLPGALSVIHESNLFPSICGRVCPQESQCEAQCILHKKMEPVAIGRLERFVGDQAPTPITEPVAKDPKKGRVAIVGSGPGGLACAGDLAREGVEVVVYEALHVVGGVLRYGIPSFRLPRESIEKEIRALENLGVRFEVNKVVGRTFTLEQLMGEMGFTAVFIATGAGYPVFLGLPGEGAGQVLSANEFLTRVNLMGGDRFPYRDTPIDLGEAVVVIGAGNTAMDCLRVSKRLGARQVHCVYRRTEAEAPARAEELRHAREEGIEFHFLRAPTEVLLDANENVRGVRCQHMELGEPDASGRRRPVPVEGQFTDVPATTVLYALGTRANPIVPRSVARLGLTKWGYIEADPVSQATNLPGVFAGGDIVTGGATVILALGAGRRAARHISAFLANRAWPPAAIEAGPEEFPAGEGKCPRCHGRIEAGEPYVCCAGASIRWQCGSCHKQYEGFAFPFGRCSACGGQLTREYDSALPDDAARAAVQQAMEVELGGWAFYERGAQSTSDPELSEMFGRLALMEREHLELLASRYHIAAPGLGSTEVGAQITALFADANAAPKTAIELLEVALGLEQRAKLFFSERTARLARGSTVWRMYRELEAEEHEHVALIETELRRRQSGKPGLL
ncbi:MAG: NADPH-dependent glutamate synthase [Myxococcales bacterium]|nr:NADPH-dependent glutamate synthase [Myxococcales bacterium]